MINSIIIIYYKIICVKTNAHLYLFLKFIYFKFNNIDISTHINVDEFIFVISNQ